MQLHIRIASTSGSKGMRCNGRCSTQLLGFDPDSLHFVTTCSFPPGSFLGAIQRLFFDVRYARSSAVAHRHIGAACWLVTARLYNLKRPKSQFCSTMRAFCMIGIKAKGHPRFAVLVFLVLVLCIICIAYCALLCKLLKVVLSRI